MTIMDCQVDYWVAGGIFEDFTFTKIDDVMVWGPFETYQEAYDIWKAEVWQNVDNALHKMSIVQAHNRSACDIANMYFQGR